MRASCLAGLPATARTVKREVIELLEGIVDRASVMGNRAAGLLSQMFRSEFIERL
jgi:hypothetical protein